MHNKNKRSIKLIRSSLKKQKKSKLMAEISAQKAKTAKKAARPKLGLRRTKTARLKMAPKKEDFLDSSEPYINLSHYSCRLKKSHTFDISKFDVTKAPKVADLTKESMINVEETHDSEKSMAQEGPGSAQNLENMPDYKFPVYKEDKIFITRRRSGTKYLKSFTVKQEMDFDVESTDEMIDDAVYLGVKGWMRSLLEEKNADYTDVLEGKKGFKRRRTLKKFVQEYKLWNNSEDESGSDDSESESASESESGSESGSEMSSDGEEDGSEGSSEDSSEDSESETDEE